MIPPNPPEPTAPSGEEQTDERGAFALANEELNGLCDGSRKFTMSIPAQDSDSDIVIGNALSIGERALSRLSAMRSEIERLTRVVALDEQAEAMLQAENAALHTELERTRAENERSREAEQRWRTGLRKVVEGGIRSGRNNFGEIRASAIADAVLHSLDAHRKAFGGTE